MTEYHKRHKKVVQSLDEVQTLNNEGILAAAAVDDKIEEETLNKFRKAIQLVESLISDENSDLDDDRSASKTSKDDSFEIETQNIIAAHDREKSAMRSSNTIMRRLYDEGMNMFSSSENFLKIQTNDGLWMSMIITAFNIGIYLVRSMESDNNDGSMAMHYFEKSLTFLCTTRILDDDKRHEDNVDIMSKLLHNIAYIHFRNGRHSNALAAYGNALKFIGSHRARLTAATLNCIGVLQCYISRQGEVEGCLHLFHGALEALRNDTTHQNDPNMRLKAIATIVNNIARAQFKMGEYVQALQSSQEAIAIRRQVYGSDHIDVAAVAFNMGQTYHVMGELDRALECYSEHLRILRLNLVSDFHRDLGEVLRHIAQLHYDRGEKEQALRAYDEAIRLTKSALGPDNSDVAHILNKKGNIQYELGDLNAALESYTEGLRIELLTLDPHHPNIIVTRGNIARIYKNLGHYDTALAEYQTVLQSQRDNRKDHPHGKDIGDDPSIAMTLHNIGLVYYQMGEYDHAFDNYQRALCIRREAFGDDDLEVASTLNSIGLVLFRQGQVSFSKKSFDECLRIRRKILGSEHRDVAVVLFNIATLLFEQGDEDDAMRVLLETLRVERAALGENHPDVIQTVQHIGHLYQNRGDLRSAIKYYEESLQMDEKNGGSRHRQWARTLNHLGNLHLQLGETERAMSCFTRAERLHRSMEEVRENGEADSLVITGYELYDISKIHPECASVA